MSKSLTISPENDPLTNIGKQQFTANQSIYQFSDKDRTVPDEIGLWRSVCTRLYRKL